MSERDYSAVNSSSFMKIFVKFCFDNQWDFFKEIRRECLDKHFYIGFAKKYGLTFLSRYISRYLASRSLP